MKKNIYRRRRRCALIILIIIVLLTKMLIFFCRDYRYAGNNDKFQKSYIVYEEGSPVIGDNSMYLEEVLAQCKNFILQNEELKSKYPYLNWKNVEEATITFCKYIEMSNGDVLKNEIAAKYYLPENKVLVMEGTYVVYNEPFLKRILIHELMHDLTYSQYLSSNLLNEAFAEKLCEKICNQNSIPFTYSTEYTYNIWLYDTLENVFGTEQLMYMCYYGFLNDMIDLYTKKGYSNKLFNVLENLDYYEKNGENSVFKKQKCEKMLKTAEDIIVHLTHNYINDPKNNCDKEVVIANCKKMLVSDEDYFLKRLE